MKEIIPPWNTKKEQNTQILSSSTLSIYSNLIGQSDGTDKTRNGEGEENSKNDGNRQTFMQWIEDTSLVHKEQNQSVYIGNDSAGTHNKDNHRSIRVIHIQFDL